MFFEKFENDWVHLSSGFGELPADVIEVEIRVPAVFEQLALQLVREYESGNSVHRDHDSEWSCKNCGEKNPTNFAVCWNCNASVDRESGDQHDD